MQYMGIKATTDEQIRQMNERGLLVYDHAVIVVDGRDKNTVLGIQVDGEPKMAYAERNPNGGIVFNYVTDDDVVH